MYTVSDQKRMKMDENRFRWGWRVLWQVWRSEHYSNALRLGSSSETLAYTVIQVAHVWETPHFWRSVLREAVKRGWCKETQESRLITTNAGETVAVKGFRCYNFDYVTSRRKPKGR